LEAVVGLDGKFNGKGLVINMTCCGRSRPVPKMFDVMGGYKYLNAQQITARLEIFKRIYCKSCPERYACDITKYNSCTIRPQLKPGG